MASNEALGTEHEVDLTGGRVRYRDRGEGPVVVFVHGALVHADLWRHVVPGLVAAGLRCVSPDWPLGAHAIPVPDMALDPPGVAATIGEFLERLDLHDVTLVANDTGGGLTQILMATRPDRVARVVLTPCDAFESFFPPRFAYLPWLARVPGGLALLARAARWPGAQRLPYGFGDLTKRAVPADVMASYLGPLRHDSAIRADARRFLSQVHRRHTLAAAEALPGFDRPVLLVWAYEDRVFPIALAHRLAERLPDARVVGVGDCFALVPEDRPDTLVEEILEFLRADRALDPGTAAHAGRPTS
jgi:pimeloyl-ACP methyl ester carboxylesterase